MSNDKQNLNDLQLLTLSKFTLSEERENALADAVEPGVHPVDFVVRVRGALVKGEAGERTPTASIPWLAALALLAKRSGQPSVDILFEVLEEALALGQGSEEVREKLIADAGVKAAMDKITKKLKELPKVPTRGPITRKYDTELILDIQKDYTPSQVTATPAVTDKAQPSVSTSKKSAKTSSAKEA